jgi:AIPR protein/abortive infection phage resistance-like protein
MLERFINQIYTDLFDTAHDQEHGGLRLTALVRILLDRLEEAGVLTAGQIAYSRTVLSNLHGEVHGYACDLEEDVLMLFLCIDPNQELPLTASPLIKTVQKDEIERGFRRLEGFIKLVRTGKVAGLDESQPVFELVQLVRESLETGRTIALNVLTTGTVSDRAAVFENKNGVPREVWDLLRLARTCSVTGDDKISINFANEFDQTLPCLVTEKAADGIQVLFTCIPGEVLAQIYSTHRARLLERNVRSFLQFAGKVNKGIRDTVLNAPSRFLPYNNGLSATAAQVEMEKVGGGLARIRAVHDFQIVNGGQTTATITACGKRDRADLSSVSIAMKLTIVPESRVDELVPLISKYANTQNRIQEADFSANNPWHIELERLSRNTWTRPTQESPRGTRWFYERSRGQYADELAAQNTPAGKRRFRSENPSPQKFTKTDLAKFLLSWDQRPAVVSRGAQKCFLDFMNQISREGRRPPAQEDFHRIIAQAILFHTAERLYGELGFQGYRANVVSYAIARLSHTLQRKVPWQEIWESQRVPDDLKQQLKMALIAVRDVILHPPTNRNITEWCKRDECWSSILNLQAGVNGLDGDSNNGNYGELAIPAVGGASVVEAVAAIPSEVWFSTSKWAKDTGSLLPWQRSLAYSLGKIASNGNTPSDKQAKQGRILLLEAHRLGYGHAQLSEAMINHLSHITA